MEVLENNIPQSKFCPVVRRRHHDQLRKDLEERKRMPVIEEEDGSHRFSNIYQYARGNVRHNMIVAEGVIAHTIRAAAIAESLGRLAGMTEDELEIIVLAVLYHDIGKMDDEVLTAIDAPGDLSAQQRLIMQQHEPKSLDYIVERFSKPNRELFDPSQRRLLMILSEGIAPGRGSPRKLAID